MWETDEDIDRESERGKDSLREVKIVGARQRYWEGGKDIEREVERNGEKYWKREWKFKIFYFHRKFLFPSKTDCPTKKKEWKR